MEIEDKIEKFASNHDNLTVEEAEEMYEEKLEELEEKATDSIPEDQLSGMTFTQVRAEWNKENATPDQSSDEIDIISIGHSGIQSWSNGDTLLAYGIANPSDEPANPAVFIIDEEDANLEEVKEHFTTFNAIKGNFTVVPSSDLSDTYVCNSTSDTEVMDSSIGMDTEEIHNWVNENHITEDVDLVDITDHLSKTNDQGYTAEFGADLRHMTSTIVDWYIPDDFSFAVCTLQDESVVDPAEELGEEIIGEGGDRTPGLTCWIDPELLEYGDYSVVDVYGTIQRDDNGQITMNAVGMYPVLVNDIDLSQVGGGSDNSGEDSSASEMSI